jgi:adenine-specific DNA-methyltransferase
MNLRKKTPSQSVNPAYLKSTIQRDKIEWFKKNLISLLDKISIVEQRPSDESEEHLKNDIRDFLRDTFYRETNAINTKDKKDLVIHTDKDTNSNVSVIIEAKRPSNKSEMVSYNNVNTKAFHELILYYLRERVLLGNLKITHLIITNINEWYIFDSRVFEKLFINSKLERQFREFESKQLSGYTTDFFYKNIAEPFVNNISTEIEYTYFNLKDYDTTLRNSDKNDDKLLVPLFKLLSPESLLKLPFVNDSNSLNEKFYSELLHIIGLTENSSKLIERNSIDKRNPGSLLENAISQLDSLDKISRLEQPSRYGNNHDERLFNVGLELSITWINRILFLKLLEAQLVKYHKGDKSYSFLNIDRIKNFDDLNSLFFMVLAKNISERSADFKILFEKVPYLNSSLFEPTEIEHSTLFISNLRDDVELPVLTKTSLRDQFGKKRQGKLSTLKYLFEFLESYDFSSDGSNEIQEEEKSLVNASVLGLIFEKLNGYKDGSYYTPGFITMYMCRESVNKAVVNKFNAVKKWNCYSIEDLLDKIEDRDEANHIFNSVKICDPAVGSGHFLVSALNQMIYLKSKLRILQDFEGQRLKDYFIEIVNDELIVRDEDGRFFQYNPLNVESQRIQKTLFDEKQKLIEQCLFGVDINPNSVKICRLRLWIELLKNSYYKNSLELETLPNIDINIKAGNSLVSRFNLDSDLKEALRQSKRSITEYKNAVISYRRAETKAQKRDMEKLISEIKSDFRSEISLNDPLIKKYRRTSGELYQMTNQGQLFDLSKKEQSAWNKKVQVLTLESKKLESEIESIKSNKIYLDAFEWRFEFPEVLNDDGEFIGFDVLIGNPPYIDSETMVKNGNAGLRDYLSSKLKYAKGNWDIYIPFYEVSYQLLSPNGIISFITPDKWIAKPFGLELRKAYLKNLIEICEAGRSVFESALVDSIITFYSKMESSKFTVRKISKSTVETLSVIDAYEGVERNDYCLDWLFSPQIELLKSIESGRIPLLSIGECENACATSDAYELVELLFNLNSEDEFNVDEHFKVINTGTIDIFGSRWGKKEMTYLKSKYLYPVVNKKEFLLKFKNTYAKKSQSPKLIIKGLTLLDATIDYRGEIVPGKSTLVFTAKESINLVLASFILNSKLAIFYIKEKYRGSSYNQGISFTKQMINSFPIPKDCEGLLSYAKDFQQYSQQHIEDNKQAIIDEINNLVYSSYGLDADEINVIEGKKKETALA